MDIYLRDTENNVLPKYYEYLESHIQAVHKAFKWIIQNIPDICEDMDMYELDDLIIMHDKSKYQDEELYAYANYFNGKKTSEVKKAFDYAWLHHQHNNPHHWQHWLLQNDNDGLKVLEMPKPYVIEMICDWWAFSWVKDDLYEIFNWYDKNKDIMILNKNTRKLVESILDSIKEKLDEENVKE